VRLHTRSDKEFRQLEQPAPFDRSRIPDELSPLGILRHPPFRGVRGEKPLERFARLPPIVGGALERCGLAPTKVRGRLPEDRVTCLDVCGRATSNGRLDGTRPLSHDANPRGNWRGNGCILATLLTTSLSSF
jgi:hypothetical protein